MTVTAIRPDTCTAPNQPGIAGYTSGCRCHRCTDDHRIYNRNRAKLIAYGQWNPLTSNDTVRTHLRQLSAAGIGRRRVSELTGISYSTLRHVGKGERMRPENVAAILALTVDNTSPADGVFIDGTGTVRRVQAMIAAGYGIAAQAKNAQVKARSYNYMLQVRSVTARNARMVAAVFETLSGTPAPDSPVAKRARNWAAREGWVPPLAWDDTDIDDPDAVPNVGAHTDDIIDEVAVAEVLAGRVRFADLREQEKLALFRDHLADWTYNRIMDLLRVSGATVQKWRTKVMYGGQVAA